MSDTVTQTNVKTGIIQVVANASLVGKEGLLAKLVNDTAVAEAALPAAQNDLALYVIVTGAAAGALADLLPISSESQVRVRLNGTCVSGDKLVLDVGAEGDYGKVKALPSAAGQYLVLGTAEQSGADEQLVLMRPNPHFAFVANATITDAAVTATAPVAITYAAPVAGATVDAEARASLAQSAADVAAIRTRQGTTITDISTLTTKVNAILAALEVSAINASA